MDCLLLLKLFIFIYHLTITPTISIIPDVAREARQAISFSGDRKDLSRRNTQYIYIGAVISIKKDSSSGKCAEITSSGVEATETFRWAIKNYRNYTKYHIPAEIRGIVFDTCGDRIEMLNHVNDFEKCTVKYLNDSFEISPQNVLGYVGPVTNNLVWNSKFVFEVINKPNIITASSLPNLNLSGKGNTFHIFPTVDSETQATCQLLQKQNWQFAIVVYSKDLYGATAYASLVHECNLRNINIIYSQVLITENENEIRNKAINFLKYSKTQLIIFLTNHKIIDIFWPILRYKFLFITPSSYGYYISNLIKDNKNGQYYAGVISLLPTVYENNITQYKNVLKSHFTKIGVLYSENIVLQQYWEQLHDCYISENSDLKKLGKSKCIMDDNLKEYKASLDENILAMPMAVFSITEAIGKLVNNLCNGTICNELYNHLVSTPKIKSYLTSQNMLSKYLSVFDSQTFGPKDKKFVITQVQKAPNSQDVKLIKIFPHSTNTQLKFYSQQLSENKIAPSCPPVLEYCRIHYSAVFQIQRNSSEYNIRFHTYRHGWDVAIAVLAAVGSLLSLIMIIFCVYYGYNGSVQFVFLRLTLILGILLGFLTTFAYMFIPSTVTCGITRFGTGFSYSLCFSVLLLLTLRWCIKPRKAWKEDSSSLFKNRLPQILLFVFIIGVEIVILIQWLITIKPNHVLVIYPDDSRRWVCNHYTGLKTQPLMWTDIKRSDFINHVLSLIYNMILILIIFLLSVVGIVKRSEDSTALDVFDRRCVTTVSFFVILWWIAWTLAGSLNMNHQHATEFADGCLAYGLLVTDTILLIYFFVHLVYEKRSPDYEHMSSKDGESSVQRSNSSHSRTSTAGSTKVSHNHYSQKKHSLTKASDSGVDVSQSNQMIEMSAKNAIISPSSIVTQSEVEGQAYSDIYRRPHHQHSPSYVLDDETQSKRIVCRDCGYGYDPNSLHLRHPRTPSTGHLPESTSDYISNSMSRDGRHSYYREGHSAHGLASAYSASDVLVPPVDGYGTGQGLKRVTRELTGSHPTIFKGNRSLSDYDHSRKQKHHDSKNRLSDKLGML